MNAQAQIQALTERVAALEDLICRQQAESLDKLSVIEKARLINDAYLSGDRRKIKAVKKKINRVDC